MNEHMSGHEAVSAGKHPSGDGTAADASASVSSATHPGEASEPISDAEGAEGAQGVPDGSPLPAATSGEIRESGYGKTACRIAGRGLVLSIALGLLSIGVCLLTNLKGELPIKIEPPVPSHHPVFTDVCTAFEEIRRVVHRSPGHTSMRPDSSFCGDFLTRATESVGHGTAEKIRGAFGTVWQQTPAHERKTEYGFGNCLYWFWVTEDKKSLVIVAEPFLKQENVAWYYYAGRAQLPTAKLLNEYPTLTTEQVGVVRELLRNPPTDAAAKLLKALRRGKEDAKNALKELRPILVEYARENHGRAPAPDDLRRAWKGPAGSLDYCRSGNATFLRFRENEPKRDWALRLEIRNPETGEPLSTTMPYEVKSRMDLIPHTDVQIFVDRAKRAAAEALNAMRQKLVDYAECHDGYPPPTKILTSWWDGPKGELEYVLNRQKAMLVRFVSDEKLVYLLPLVVESNESGENAIFDTARLEDAEGLSVTTHRAVRMLDPPEKDEKDPGLGEEVKTLTQAGITFDDMEAVRDVVAESIGWGVTSTRPKPSELKALILKGVGQDGELRKRVNTCDWIVLDHVNGRERVLLCYGPDETVSAPQYVIPLTDVDLGAFSGPNWVRQRGRKFGVEPGRRPSGLKE